MTLRKQMIFSILLFINLLEIKEFKVFGWFKRRKKVQDIDELEKLSNEDDKEEQYQLSMSSYRDTSLAQKKKKSNYSFEKAPEEDK